jgi:hypothetical protein
MDVSPISIRAVLVKVNFSETLLKVFPFENGYFIMLEASYHPGQPNFWANWTIAGRLNCSIL